MSNKFSDKIKYKFDDMMSKGPIALIIWLAILSFIIILTVSGVIWFFRLYPEEQNFIKLMWMSLMRTLDAGTMGGDVGSWGFLLSMFAVTLGGVFIISALIGILTTGLESKLEELRKGRSRVIEKKHTIILGWSEQIFTIVSELITANESKRKSCILIMGDRDKVEMEEEIKSKIGKIKKTKIVCRQGSPIELNDLDIVNLNSSQSIIILSPENNPDPDASVIKTILAIINYPKRRKSEFNLVAEIRDPKNVEIAKIVGKNELEIVLVGDLISRIIAQTCRQSGLSLVYTELLDFGGAEIYFTKEKALTGKKFGDALLRYNDSTVIGIFKDQNSTELNPPMDSIINDNDSLILIAEDDSMIKISNINDLNINKKAIRLVKKSSSKNEKILILGWNWRVTRIINELDNYVSGGSEVVVVADYEDGGSIIKKECLNQVKYIKIKFINEDTTNRKTLDKLISQNYNHIIVVCYDEIDPQAADAKTLITLLHLRDISSRTGKSFSIVSEMLDIKNRNLAEIAKANDFIVSDKIISLLLTQISENKKLNGVFTDLFDPEGSEIYLKPVQNYIKIDTDVNFYTITEAAKQLGEIAIGYKIESLCHDPEKSYGVYVSPVKNKMIKFSKDDKIIVLSEE